MLAARITFGVRKPAANSLGHAVILIEAVGAAFVAARRVGELLASRRARLVESSRCEIAFYDESIRRGITIIESDDVPYIVPKRSHLDYCTLSSRRYRSVVVWLRTSELYACVYAEFCHLGNSYLDDQVSLL
jgi:hypothetical protein